MTCKLIENIKIPIVTHFPQLTWNLAIRMTIEHLNSNCKWKLLKMQTPNLLKVFSINKYLWENLKIFSNIFRPKSNKIKKSVKLHKAMKIKISHFFPIQHK